MNKDKFIKMLEQAKEDEYGRLYVLGEYNNKIYFGIITTICEDEKDLTNELNDFIEDIYKQDKEVIDIKYSTSIAINDDDEQIYIYSALVMYDDKICKAYKPKIYEIVEKVEEE